MGIVRSAHLKAGGRRTFDQGSWKLHEWQRNAAGLTYMYKVLHNYFHGTLLCKSVACSRHKLSYVCGGSFNLVRLASIESKVHSSAWTASKGEAVQTSVVYAVPGNTVCQRRREDNEVNEAQIRFNDSRVRTQHWRHGCNEGEKKKEEHATRQASWQVSDTFAPLLKCMHFLRADPTST